MNPVDFLPEHIRISRQRRANLIRQGYLLVLCVAGLALLGYLRQGRISEAKAELVLLNTRAVNVAGQIAMRSSLEAEQAELLLKQRIDEQLGSRVSALDIMGELQTVMSDRLTLIDMKIETMDVRLAIQRVPGGGRGRSPITPKTQYSRRVRLVITGLAPSDIDVANFIGQIAASPLFEDIEMGYSLSAEYNNRKVREFQLTCLVVR